jgi:signal transduction histidine kinase
VLRVIDDGSGVAPTDLTRPGHYGIIGMCERVEALGGTLKIVAGPRGGTVVEAKVPVQDVDGGGVWGDTQRVPGLPNTRPFPALEAPEKR